MPPNGRELSGPTATRVGLRQGISRQGATPTDWSALCGVRCSDYVGRRPPPWQKGHLDTASVATVHERAALGGCEPSALGLLLETGRPDTPRAVPRT